VAYFSKTSEKIIPNGYASKVKAITIRVCVTNCAGTFYITDLFLQAGFV